MIISRTKELEALRSAKKADESRFVAVLADAVWEKPFWFERPMSIILDQTGGAETR